MAGIDTTQNPRELIKQAKHPEILLKHLVLSNEQDNSNAQGCCRKKKLCCIQRFYANP